MRSLMTPALRAVHRNIVLRVGLAVLGAVVVLACGMTTPPVLVATAPASDLELFVTLTGAFSAGDGLAQLRVGIADTSKGHQVRLSGGQRLTCDGVSDPSETHGPWVVTNFSVPQQPPGGAYTCIYTDERGQQNTATIAVPPPGRVAITSPAAGAQVPIPGPLGPNATVPPTYNPSRGATRVDQPLVIQYVAPTLPGYVASLPGHVVIPPEGPYAIVDAETGCGNTPQAAAPCPAEYGCEQPAAGVCLVSDAGTPYGYGFEQTVPGPGYIQLTLTMRWSAPAGGFRSIRVDTTDQATTPITWTARAGGG